MPDEVAEWLRRWTANPLGSPRVGSNPILVVYFLLQYIRKKYEYIHSPTLSSSVSSMSWKINRQVSVYSSHFRANYRQAERFSIE